MTPLFSVVTPLLDGIMYIPGYINSLRSQTCSDWEAVIVDDGSSDGGLQVLMSLIADDYRFRVFINNRVKTVHGPYQARNLGLDLALGKYICFLDIDDRWLPSKLSSQKIEILFRPSLGLLFSSYYRISNGCLHEAKVRRPLPWLSPSNWIAVANPVPMLTSCVRRSLLTGIRFKPAYHEDYLFWHEVFCRISIDEIYCGSAPIAVYNVSDFSLSGNKVRSSFWIWRCYRILGYSLVVACVAFLARGLLQCVVVIFDVLARPVDITYILKLV